MKDFEYPIKNRARNLLACSAVPQTIALSHFPGNYKSTYLLVQPFKGVGLDSRDFVSVERQYLQGVESLEGLIVDRGDSIVVQVQDQQVVQVVDCCGWHRKQSVLGQVQLRQFVS